MQIVDLDNAGMESAANALIDGQLVAVPTETVYGLAADATNDSAVAKIFAAKGRPQFNPLIAHVNGLDMARQFGKFDDISLKLVAAFWPGPLTLVVPAVANSKASVLVSAGLPTIGLRHPKGIMAKLAGKLDRPLAAPSANSSGKISPTSAQHVADDLGKFCARTLFRGSDLSMDTGKRKADVALFAESVALNDITETLVFTDPYYDATRNHHTPGLDEVVARLRADVDLKVEAQHLKAKFANNAETMLHGDFHTGSVMVTDTETKVIDPEFVLYGPMGFDVGMLLANFWMVYFTMPAHIADTRECASYQEWILDVAAGVWDSFTAEFTHLWRTERTGILYEPCLFEDQGQPLGAEQALAHRLSAIWEDALGFAGVEMLRRILSLAHNEENESITDEGLRAKCETQELALGRQLVVNRGRMGTISQVHDLARKIAGEASA